MSQNRQMKRKLNLPEISDLRTKYGDEKKTKVSLWFPEKLKRELMELAETQGYGFNFTETLIALSEHWVEQEKGKGRK